MTVTVADAEEAAEARRARLFRALAQSPGPLSTPELAGLLAEPVPRPRLLSWYGHILRREAQAGRVERGGLGSGRGHPFIWGITRAGRAWLDEHDKAPALAAVAAAEAERKAEEARRAAVERGRALDEARASFTRQAPRLERKRAAHHLRALGCTLDEIGLVFGVSREMIRQDLLWDSKPPIPRTRKPRTSRTRKPPAVRTRKPPRRPRPHFSPAQAELLLDMYLGHHAEYYPLSRATSSALQKRGLITKGSGLGSIALTAEGQAAARQLAEDTFP